MRSKQEKAFPTTIDVVVIVLSILLVVISIKYPTEAFIAWVGIRVGIAIGIAV